MGAIPGIAIDALSMIVPTSTGCFVLAERNAITKVFCPCASSPFSF